MITDKINLIHQSTSNKIKSSHHNSPLFIVNSLKSSAPEVQRGNDDYVDNGKDVEDDDDVFRRRNKNINR